MPAVDQVFGTLPTAFRENFPTTYALINGSEVIIETPSDPSMQHLLGASTNITTQ